jgi:hypothetical protein
MKKTNAVLRNFAVVKSRKGVQVSDKGALCVKALSIFAGNHSVGDTVGLGTYLSKYLGAVKSNLTASKFVRVADVQNACDVLNEQLITEGKALQIYGDVSEKRTLLNCFIRLTAPETLEYMPEKKEAEKASSVATPEEQATALAKQAGEIADLTIKEYLNAVLTACREKYGEDAYKKAFGDLITEYEEKKNRK